MGHSRIVAIWVGVAPEDESPRVFLLLIIYILFKDIKIAKKQKHQGFL